MVEGPGDGKKKTTMQSVARMVRDALARAGQRKEKLITNIARTTVAEHRVAERLHDAVFNLPLPEKFQHTADEILTYFESRYRPRWSEAQKELKLSRMRNGGRTIGMKYSEILEQLLEINNAESLNEEEQRKVKGQVTNEFKTLFSELYDESQLFDSIEPLFEASERSVGACFFPIKKSDI